MKDQSKTSPQKTSSGSLNATSSPESRDGRLLFASQDGQTISRCGQDLAHASLSPRQARSLGLMTTDICGLHSVGSYGSRSLQSSLENKLRQRLPISGSISYSMTWKEWTTPSGVLRSRLRASAARTSETGIIGWPTPTSRDWKDGSSAGSVPISSRLGRMVWLYGDWTASSGSLNPEHSRWLMGFPAEWGRFAPTATQCRQKQRQNS